MATKVSVVTNPGSRISINSQQKMAIRYVSQGASPGATRLDQLLDVDVSNKANNDVLVYDENIGKFVSKIIPVVDGGAF
jgi:hypothetical protein